MSQRFALFETLSAFLSMRRTPYFTANVGLLSFSIAPIFYGPDPVHRVRKGLPEKQSVRARDGAADPHGCGNYLRSGNPLWTLHLQPTAIISSVQTKEPLTPGSANILYCNVTSS
ncbi:hypothetical protein FD733_03970 [Pantoea sp. Eser]|nr:hypothetical protein [Pantoea sp. Eser]